MLVTADFEWQVVKKANVEQRDSEYDLPALHIFIGIGRNSTSAKSRFPSLFDQKSSRKMASRTKVAFYPILSVP